MAGDLGLLPDDVCIGVDDIDASIDGYGRGLGELAVLEALREVSPP